MPQADRNRPTHRLTRRTYSLTSRRGPTWPMLELGTIAAGCAAAALAAAGFALFTSRDNSKKADALCAPPMSERDIREQLAKARIALDHEVATRLVMEQQASQSLAEIHPMRTDLPQTSARQVQLARTQNKPTRRHISLPMPASTLQSRPEGVFPCSRKNLPASVKPS